MNRRELLRQIATGVAAGAVTRVKADPFEETIVPDRVKTTTIHHNGIDENYLLVSAYPSWTSAGDGYVRALGVDTTCTDYWDR